MAPKEAKADKAEKPKKTPMQRAMELIPALSESDDERTRVSKKVSWILRHGARKVNCKISDDGWVLIDDLIKVDIMDGISKATLMKIVADSNLNKLRYALEGDNAEQKIKALMKQKKSAAAAGDATAAAAARPSVDTTASGAANASLNANAPTFVPSTPGPPTSPAGGAGFPMMPYANYFGYMNSGYPWPFMPGIPPAPPPQSAMGASAGPAAQAAGYFRGKIKFFDEKKGYGFLECKEAFAIYKRDVFLHKVDLRDLEVGSEVSFTVDISKKGMPQARNVTLLKHAVPGTQEKGAGGKGKGKGKRSGKSGKAGGTKADAEPRQPVEPGAVAAAPPPPPAS